jgi:predicted TIM-barrel fold metal-dependent hydrolase
MSMPYGGNDWLALTQEPTLEPELPICDPHHHFWDRRLQSLPYQRYLLDELHADIYSGHHVRSTVFLEARSMYRPDGPVEMRPVGEVEFVQGLAAASASGIYGPSRAAAAIIGHADLKRGANVAPVLDALQAASPNRFRGIRHNVTWSPDPAVDNRESEGILANATFREGAKILRQKGLSLDIMLSFPQMPEVADFARAVPELPIILNHIGALNRVGLYANREDEVRAAWQAGIAAVAACPISPSNWAAWACPAWDSTGTPGRSPSARKHWPQTWRRGCTTVLSSLVQSAACSKAIFRRTKFPFPIT